jgi:hypothetical protein
MDSAADRIASLRDLGFVRMPSGRCVERLDRSRGRGADRVLPAAHAVACAWGGPVQDPRKANLRNQKENALKQSALNRRISSIKPVASLRHESNL